MICSHCGASVTGDFCTTCGAKAGATDAVAAHGPYSEYMRFYPDKWAAISALRCSTGMPFTQANKTIEDLFGVSHDDECKAADAEQELIYQQQYAQEEHAASPAGLSSILSKIFKPSKKGQ